MGAQEPGRSAELVGLARWSHVLGGTSQTPALAARWALPMLPGLGTTSLRKPCLYPFLAPPAARTNDCSVPRASAAGPPSL